MSTSSRLLTLRCAPHTCATTYRSLPLSFLRTIVMILFSFHRHGRSIELQVVVTPVWAIDPCASDFSNTLAVGLTDSTTLSLFSVCPILKSFHVLTLLYCNLCIFRSPLSQLADIFLAHARVSHDSITSEHFPVGYPVDLFLTQLTTNYSTQPPLPLTYSFLSTRRVSRYVLVPLCIYNTLSLLHCLSYSGQFSVYSTSF